MQCPGQFVVAVIASISLVGCAEPPQRVPVSGTVLIDGQPLTGGSIRFVPASGRPVTSVIMTDGSFELSESSISAPSASSGVLPGVYRVAVSAPEILSEQSEEVRWLAPPKYADFRTSEIEVTIDRPKDDLRIELTWEGYEQVDEDSSAAETADEEAENTSGPLGQTDQEASSGK